MYRCRGVYVCVCYCFVYVSVCKETVMPRIEGLIARWQSLDSGMGLDGAED